MAIVDLAINHYQGGINRPLDAEQLEAFLAGWNYCLEALQSQATTDNALKGNAAMIQGVQRAVKFVAS